MTRRVLFVLAALTAASPAGAQDRRPVRLFAEAEDFTVTSPGWKVMAYRDNYYASTFAVTFLSRMGCLSAPDEIAPGKKAVAEQAITIPYDDTYELLARYEQPFQFACEFTVEVEQGGKVVASFPCGRLEQPEDLAAQRPQAGGDGAILVERHGQHRLAATGRREARRRTREVAADRRRADGRRQAARERREAQHRRGVPHQRQGRDGGAEEDQLPRIRRLAGAGRRRVRPVHQPEGRAGPGGAGGRPVRPGAALAVLRPRPRLADDACPQERAR